MELANLEVRVDAQIEVHSTPACPFCPDHPPASSSYLAARPAGCRFFPAEAHTSDAPQLGGKPSDGRVDADLIEHG
jgi:hypothetical protein